MWHQGSNGKRSPHAKNTSPTGTRQTIPIVHDRPRQREGVLEAGRSWCEQEGEKRCSDMAARPYIQPGKIARYLVEALRFVANTVRRPHRRGLFERSHNQPAVPSASGELSKVRKAPFWTTEVKRTSSGTSRIGTDAARNTYSPKGSSSRTVGIEDIIWLTQSYGTSSPTSDPTRSPGESLLIPLTSNPDESQSYVHLTVLYSNAAVVVGDGIHTSKPVSDPFNKPALSGSDLVFTTRWRTFTDITCTVIHAMHFLRSSKPPEPDPPEMSCPTTYRSTLSSA